MQSEEAHALEWVAPSSSSEKKNTAFFCFQNLNMASIAAGDRGQKVTVVDPALQVGDTISI